MGSFALKLEYMSTPEVAIRLLRNCRCCDPSILSAPPAAAAIHPAITLPSYTALIAPLL